MKITHNDRLGGMSWEAKQCRLSGEADPTVRESLSRKVTFELFLMTSVLKRCKPCWDLGQECPRQRERCHPFKGPMVEPSLECSRNRTLPISPRDGQWPLRKVKTEAVPSHLLLGALRFQR